jgi:hypothetical protein
MNIKNAIVNANLIFFSTAFSIIMVEIFFKYVIKPKTITHIWQTNDENHYPRPYVMAAAKPYLNFNGDSHNILGYRDFPSVEKSNDEFRVVMIGGSTVHGGVVSLPKMVELKLKNRGITNARVYNLGIGSSVSRQDILRIMIDLAGYSPDLIVHYGGGNEITTYTDPRINYPHRFIHYEHNVYFTQSRDFDDWIISLLMGSELFRYLFEKKIGDWVFQKVQIHTPPNSQYNVLKMQAYIQNLRWGNILANQLGAKFLAIFQPVLSFKETIHEDEKRHTNNDLNLKINIFRNELYKILNNNITFDFHDCSKVFEKSTKKDFLDTIHLTENSNSEVAECVVDKLMSDIELLSWKNNLKEKFIPEEIFLRGF